MSAVWASSVRTILGEIRDFSLPSPVALKQFIKASDAFDKENAFPVKTTRCKNLKLSEVELTNNINGCYPLVHEEVLRLACAFLVMKRSHGSTKEKNLYVQLDILSFFDRLLAKRPLVFVGSGDSYLLRGGKIRGHGGFDTIGTDAEVAPLLLANLMSYDEVKLAALVNFTGPTAIINSGSRHNCGVSREGKTPFEPHAIYVGLVGARFEKRSKMESQEIIIRKEMNVAGNGYGLSKELPLDEREPTSCLELMAQLYDQKYGFPSIEEMTDVYVSDKIKSVIRPMESYMSTAFFNAEIYRKRIYLSVFPFLAEANHRAKLAGKSAYVHVVGLGLGVWRVFKDQNDLFVQVFAEILSATKFEAISDVDFSYLFVDKCGGVGNGHVFPGTRIKIHFSKRDPFTKLTGENEGKLIVASWAYDGNSFIGNEYWDHALTASGDPAAACCSQIPETLNPCINPMMCGANMRVVMKDGDVVTLKSFVEKEISG